MSYLVLARKYRPRSFAEVMGQQPVVQALANALDNQRLHHAYLFTGTRGVGKTTLARILAACFNCERGITSQPCGTCGACTEIAAGRFVDLIEVDAASRTGVEDTRELLNNAQFLPGQGRFKVYLIDEVHMLTGHSFNALLKTLEEPPEHVKFLLATTEAKKIPVTVLSRCLQFNLRNMLPETIQAQLAKVLEAEDIAAEPAALQTIAQAAAGSMRDALSIADQAVAHGGGKIGAASVDDMLGIAGRDEVNALLDALAANDAARLLQVGDDLVARSVDLAAVLGELQRAFHDLAIAKELGAAPANTQHERFAAAFSAEDLQLYYQIALLGLRDLQFAPDAKVGFDMTLIRLVSFEPEGGAAVAPTGEGNQEERPGAMAAQGSRPAGNPRQAVAAPPRQPAPPPPEPPPADDPQAAASTTPAAPVSAPAPPPETKAPPAMPQEPMPEPSETAAKASPAPAKEPAPDDNGWHELVRAMQADGVTGMILDNSNLLGRSPERWRILLDEGHGSLLNDKRRAEIADLAAHVEGRAVEVELTTGEPQMETPAQRTKRRQAEEHEQAQATLMQDANVQALLRDFDGRLESAQLHPSPAVEASGAQAAAAP